MTKRKTLALILGLSTASLLAACGGKDTAGTSSEVTIEDTEANKVVNTDNAIARCPDNKILASHKAYNALALPISGDDYAAWHAENGKRSDVTTTASGLQYKVVQDGLENGASPVGGEVVTVHYHGYFPDGNVFDSSYSRGETIDFPANAVIKGWVEALQDMKTCEARTLYIPGDLAYGPNGRPGIPPNATLLFNVQLIGVTKN